MEKQQVPIEIQVVMSNGTVYTIKHPYKVRDVFLISMPREFGGFGIGVWDTEEEARKFSEHIYDDKDLRADKELWEKLHGVEVSPHTIRKISGTSVISVVLRALAEESAEPTKEG